MCAQPPLEPRAALVEIFDSIQGEGRFVGVPMAFVRVATCPLRCIYCDTPHSYVATAEFAVAAPSRAWRESNPVTSLRAAALVRDVVGKVTGKHPVSITGGEPLAYPSFILGLGEALGASFPLHLETAALDAAALRTCLPALAHLSADYKLPETVQGQLLGDAHVACVAAAAARGGVTIDVKVVLTAEVADASLQTALRQLSPFAADILLVLQPVTPFGAVRTPPPADRMQAWTAMARAAGFAVRVLPQVHKMLGVP